MTDDAKQPDAPIFIVGCPRSGTTLLRNLLRSHPRLSFPPETHFIPQLYKAYGELHTKVDVRKLSRLILSLEWVKSWECTFDKDALYACHSYREIINELFNAWLRHEGKKRWGDKTPHYVLYLTTLARIFPDAKIIHIYRDGRDVAKSWVKSPFGPENLYAAAAQWQHFVQSGRQAGAMLPSHTYMEVCFETLLQKTEAILRRLCAFIDESFDPAMLKPNVLPMPAQRIRIPILGTYRRGLATQPYIVKGNSHKWKMDLTVDERALVEAIAGPTLQILGYELEGHQRRVPLYSHWWWVAHSRIKEVLVKLNTRNKRLWIATIIHMKKAQALARLRHWRNKILC